MEVQKWLLQRLWRGIDVKVGHGYAQHHIDVVLSLTVNNNIGILKKKKEFNFLPKIMLRKYVSLKY